MSTQPQRVEYKVGDTTITIELNISVKEHKNKAVSHRFQKGRANPMKGKHFPKVECKLCGKEIGSNSIGKHMRRVHNVSQ